MNKPQNALQIDYMLEMYPGRWDIMNNLKNLPDFLVRYPVQHIRCNDHFVLVQVGQY